MNPDKKVEFPGDFRIHIGLSTANLDRSREFYQTLFGERPVKEKPGYVKFEPRDPSVNLSLNEVSTGATLSNSRTHYGVQMKSGEALQAIAARISNAGFTTRNEESTTCCYAVQDKVWAADPDGNEWEVFVVLEDSEVRKQESGQNCCPTDCCQVR